MLTRAASVSVGRVQLPRRSRRTMKVVCFRPAGTTDTDTRRKNLKVIRQLHGNVQDSLKTWEKLLSTSFRAGSSYDDGSVEPLHADAFIANMNSLVRSFPDLTVDCYTDGSVNEHGWTPVTTRLKGTHTGEPFSPLGGALGLPAIPAANTPLVHDACCLVYIDSGGKIAEWTIASDPVSGTELGIYEKLGGSLHDVYLHVVRTCMERFNLAGAEQQLHARGREVALKSLHPSFEWSATRDPSLLGDRDQLFTAWAELFLYMPDLHMDVGSLQLEVLPSGWCLVEYAVSGRHTGEPVRIDGKPELKSDGRDVSWLHRSMVLVHGATVAREVTLSGPINGEDVYRIMSLPVGKHDMLHHPYDIDDESMRMEEWGVLSNIRLS
ncbi:unnamed protein product [Pedinophyceae sp. YPF-701]|nr:unnamed protein product [Pedinophyceae sp. YPF-701]